MRIKILVTGLPPYHIGGTETQTYNLAKHLAGKHDVMLITRREKGAESESHADGVTIKRFRYINIPVFRFFSHLISSLNVVRKVRKETDILCCMMLSPNGFVGILAKRLFGLKTIASIRGGDWYMSGFFGSLINRFVLKNSDMILAQTGKIKKDVLSRYPEIQINVIPNGVDMKRERASGNKVIFLGNLHERKGVEYLLKAMVDVDSELIVLGDGSEMSRLRSLAHELKLGSKVAFLGKIDTDDVRKHMLQGSVFVLPSIEGEGMPNVILEAMSVGLPVVSTDISGIPDIIKDGKTGFIVKTRSPESIAMALKKLQKNKKLQREMSNNCIREVKRYSWGNVTKMFDDIMTEK